MPADETTCPVCKRSFGAGVQYCPVDGSALHSRRTRPGTQVPRARTPSPAPVEQPGTSDPYIGIRIHDHIELRKLIGSGSMARVYRAFQEGVDRDVAVKVLHRELAANPDVVDRFQREAKLASKIDHPHVVRILMTARLPESRPATPTRNPDQDAAGPLSSRASNALTRGGELVIVMEHIEGRSLAQALKEDGPMKLSRALHIALQVCDAVGEAHALGVVHRDIKPENILLVRRGDDPDFVKVVDFGLARLCSTDATYSTKAGAVFGSPKYISPEGAQGMPVGPAADVYAIATVLFQCIAGRTPFVADTPVALLLAHAQEKAPLLSNFVSSTEAPAELVEIIAKNLGKRAEDRAASARVLGAEIVDFAEKNGITLPIDTTRPWRAIPSQAIVQTTTRPIPIGPELAAAIAPSRTGTVIPADSNDPDFTDIASSPNRPFDAKIQGSRPPNDPPSSATSNVLPIENSAVQPKKAVDSRVDSTMMDEPLAVAFVPTIAPETSRAPGAPADSNADVRNGTNTPAAIPPSPLEIAPSVTGAELIAKRSTGPKTIPPEELPSSAVEPISSAFESSVASHATGTAPITLPVRAPQIAVAPSPDEVVHRPPSHTAPGFSQPTRAPDDDAIRPVNAWARWRPVAVVAACFVIGVLAATLGASKLGWQRNEPAAVSQAEPLYQQALDAETKQNWGSAVLDPNGATLRDVIHRARAEYPDDERFVVIQQRACAQLRSLATKAKNENRLTDAMNFARTALAIQPDDPQAAALVRELESTSLPVPSATLKIPASPSTTTKKGTPAPPTTPTTTGTSTGTAAPAPTRSTSPNPTTPPDGPGPWL